MGIINIDTEAFEELLEKVNKIYRFVIEHEFHNDEEEPWIDSYEVSVILNISLKTLQRLRKKRLLPYSIMQGRCRYRPSAINKAINERVIVAAPKHIEDFRKNYINHAK